MDKALKDPVISVIMPVFNTGRYLKESITSILNQSFGDFEFLIFNDGSTDNSADVIRSFKDERIIFYDYAVNKGYIDCFNEGLTIARGQFIARMDSDDITLPGRFQSQLEIFKIHPEVGVCGGWVQPLQGYTKLKPWRYSSEDEYIRADFLFGNPIANPTAIIRRRLFVEHKLSYSAEYFPAEDYHLWFRLQNLTRFYNVPKVLLYYRLHDKQTSYMNDKPLNITKKILKLFLFDSGLSNDSDIIMFEKFVLNSWERNTEFLNGSAEYLNKLIKKNDHLHRFNKDYFRLIVQKFFWRQCYFATSKSCNGLKIYYKLMDEKQFYPSLTEQFKTMGKLIL